MTNFEKVKQMSVDEFTEKLEDVSCNFCSYKHVSCNISQCFEGTKKWLESEAEDDEF